MYATKCCDRLGAADIKLRYFDFVSGISPLVLLNWLYKSNSQYK